MRNRRTDDVGFAVFVLAWTSGHIPPRTMFFMEIGKHWNATEKLSEATRFNTPDAAIDTYRTRCTAWPEYEPYVSAIKSGRVRAEHLDQGTLAL